MSRREKAKPESIELVAYLKQFKHDFCVLEHCDIILSVSRRERIVFDRSQLEQVLIILCENALQHGRDNTGKVKITISIKHDDHLIKLIVCDTGPGVPEAIRDSIFDPFFSTLKNGNGMGLFIAKDLCEINQARLSLAESKQGCCFSISLSQSDEL